MKIADFLRVLHPDGPYHLTAFSSTTGKLRGVRTFDDADAAETAALRTNEQKANLYFQPAELAADFRDQPSGKADVVATQWLWSEVDIKDGVNHEQLAILKDHIRAHGARLPEPTLVWDSGHGLWFGWRIPRTTDLDLIERINAGIRDAIGSDDFWAADNVQNVDRIARLPGTKNWPTKRKLDRGRLPVPLPAVVLEYNDVTHSIEDFPQAATNAKPTVEVDSSKIERLAVAQDIVDKHGCPPRVGAIIAHGFDPDQPKEGDNSRSAWLFDAVCQMVRANVPDGLILGIITDPGYKISESVLEKPDPMRYATKQLRSAKGKIESEEDFTTDDNGKPHKTARNVRVALRKLGLELSRDEFAAVELVNGRYVTDEDLRAAWILADEKFKLDVGKERFFDWALDAASRNSFHPVKDYFDSLTWDGTPRLDTWLVNHCGAEDTPYVRAVGALIFMAVYKRVMEPGCKFDEMPIFENPKQGTNKSGLWQAIAIREDWYLGQMPLGADAKVIIERTRGKLVAEASELDGMKKSDVEAVKSMLDTQEDVARLAYDRVTARVKRSFIIGGTTNKENYLKDSTGNRRFWPIAVKDIDLAAVRENLDQLYAEAITRVRSGGSIRLPEELWASAGEEQEKRRLVNPFVEIFEDVLGDLKGKVATSDLWRILDKGNANHRSQQDNQNIADAMQELGFKKPSRDGRLRRGGKPVPCYVNVPSTVAKWIKITRNGDGWDAEVVDEEDVPPDTPEGPDELPF